MEHEYTIAPVGVSTGSDAEFCDLQGLQRLYGIKRGMAYQLMRDKKIHGITLRRNGRQRGKRLIEIQSVRKFLNECASD
jgi:hypothetical protein